MIYKEEKRDLFSLSREYMLVHCISADYALGAGVAKVFRDRYKVKDALMLLDNRNVWNNTGRCQVVNVMNENGESIFVANLVTKHRYYHKPTYDTLQEALRDLKQQLTLNYPDIQKIGMPLIGCGLDKLKWDKVSEIIQQEFDSTNLEITVCYL